MDGAMEAAAAAAAGWTAARTTGLPLAEKWGDRFGHWEGRQSRAPSRRCFVASRAFVAFTDAFVCLAEPASTPR